MKPIKSVLIILLLSWIVKSVSGQSHISKPPLDFAAIENWQSVDREAAISSDGKYIAYFVATPYKDTRSLVILSTFEDWKVSIPNARGRTLGFTPDGKSYLRKQGDSLCIITLGSNEKKFLTGVSSFAISQGRGSIQYAYLQMQDNGRNNLILQCKAGQQVTYVGVNRFQFTKDETMLFFMTGSEEDTAGQTLHGIDSRTLKTYQFYQSKPPFDYIYDGTHKQIAILAGKEITKTVLVRKFDKGGVRTVLEKTLAPTSTGLYLAGLRDFSISGKTISVTLREPDIKIAEKDPNAVKVTIWHYKDKINASDQSTAPPAPQEYAAIIRLEDGSVEQLEKPGIQASRMDGQDKWVISKNDKWNAVYTEADKSTISISKFSENEEKSLWPTFSTTGNYILYFDKVQRNYFSFEIATGMVRNLTQNLKTDWTYDWDGVGSIGNPRWLCTLIKGTDLALVFDNHDIWLLDMTSKKEPVCITGQYGAKHGIEFSLTSVGGSIDSKKEFLVSAFDTRTKENGAYLTSLAKPGDPAKVKLLPMLFATPECLDNDCNSYKPIKAANEMVYLVRGSYDFGSNNYYTTTDFKEFKQQTHIAPEKYYNWRTRDVIPYTLPDGTHLTGLLNKPEDFDPAKKYPLIIYYYQKLSQNRFVYSATTAAGLAVGPINIPWMVSHGYLVLEADIRYRLGHTGESAFECINAATDVVAKLPYVDSTKMGIQGHSFGGYETNYIVTHTSRFAAAASAEGVSDLVSSYADNTRYSEIGQGRMNGTPWDSQENYIKNSPIFFADKVTTPLLIMNDKEDQSVPYNQGFEFYISLRRTGKKVWMLDYEGEGHTLYNVKNQKDYTVRLQQFFDHYLKEAPAPKWMTQGIPGYLKGIADGLDLDPTDKP